MTVKIENWSKPEKHTFSPDTEWQALAIEQRELYRKNLDKRQAGLHSFRILSNTHHTVSHREAIVESSAIVAPVDANA